MKRVFVYGTARLHESQKKMVAVSNHLGVVDRWGIASTGSRFCVCSLHLHSVLGVFADRYSSVRDPDGMPSIKLVFPVRTATVVRLLSTAIAMKG